MNYRSELERRKSSLNTRKALLKKVETDVIRLEEEVRSLKERSQNLTDISSFLNTFADEKQAELHGKIEAVVTAGLVKIFEEDIRLKIVSKMVGSRTEIDFVLVTDTADGALETSVLEARGGGVAAVTGFLIQTVLVMLTPGLRKTVFLDETFSQVSQDFRPNLGEFLKELTDTTDLQIVMVTHDPVFEEYADKVYRFTQSNGVTKVMEDR